VYADWLLPRWLGWTRDAPRDVTTTFRIMNLPDHPAVPPALRDGTIVCVDGAVRGGGGGLARARQLTDDLLGPLRSVAAPLLDTWHPTTPTAVAETHMDPAEPFPVYGDHMLLDDIGGEGAGVLLGVAGAGSGSPLTNAELRQLGGAVAEPDPSGGVLDHIDAPLAYMGGGVPLGGVTAESITRHCAVVRSALAPWDAGATAPTFVEHFDQPQGHLSPDDAREVERIRARVDPSGLFRGDVLRDTERSR
jgi:hypothetical protein